MSASSADSDAGKAAHPGLSVMQLLAAKGTRPIRSLDELAADTFESAEELEGVPGLHLRRASSPLGLIFSRGPARHLEPQGLRGLRSVPRLAHPWPGVAGTRRSREGSGAGH